MEEMVELIPLEGITREDMLISLINEATAQLNISYRIIMQLYLMNTGFFVVLFLGLQFAGVVGQLCASSVIIFSGLRMCSADIWIESNPFRKLVYDFRDPEGPLLSSFPKITIENLKDGFLEFQGCKDMKDIISQGGSTHNQRYVACSKLFLMIKSYPLNSFHTFIRMTLVNQIFSWAC